eukprot:CCRYP_010672-RA/>CCRYP_010672-RA protein AED:0.02 eAED:0.02 QI:1143/1/1/1/0.33/0.25/4/205/377
MPPSQATQYINRMLHKEPLASIFHTFFWAFILLFACPLAGFFLVLSSPARLLYAVVNDRRRINACQDDMELCVVVTGCDCGFGKDLAFELCRRGFVVFAGCRSLNESGHQFEGANNIIPLQMDVTKHDEISQAARTVAKWMSPVRSGSKKILHAIVNNAGKGETKLFDWYESTERISSDVDVNFYGSVIVIQQFLPLLKKQYQTNKQWSTENGAHLIKSRIINVVSMAGLVNGTIGASMYHASKHALEGFAASLRVELFPFGIDVININPSFHKTNIVSDLTARLRKSWENIPPSRRCDYSEEFCKRVASKLENNFSTFLWEPNAAIDTILSAVELKYPSCQYIVGSDAKTILLVARWLPQEFLSRVIRNDVDLPSR